MPYVNIPESGLSGGVAVIIGKLQGELGAKLLEQTSTIQDRLRSQGCSALKNNDKNKIQGLSNALTGIDKRLNKFRRLPKKLRVPLSALKKALKLILLIPIPQSIPPGFGIPVGITTKFADIMHLIKEFIKQIDEIIKALEAALKTPNIQVNALNNVLRRVNTVVGVCEIEKAVQQKIENNELTIEQMIELGFINDEGEGILSNLIPEFIGVSSDDTRSVRDIANETGQSVEDVANKIADDIKKAQSGDSTTDPSEGSLTNFNNKLDELLRNLQSADGISDPIKNDLTSTLTSFKIPPPRDQENDGRFFYEGPNGEKYKLEIRNVPDSPTIAPQRFAVALDNEGVAVLKGAKSFASDVGVLLDELKFRLDNQLS